MGLVCVVSLGGCSPVGLVCVCLGGYSPVGLVCVCLGGCSPVGLVCVSRPSCSIYQRWKKLIVSAGVEGLEKAK